MKKKRYSQNGIKDINKLVKKKNKKTDKEYGFDDLLDEMKEKVDKIIRNYVGYGLEPNEIMEYLDNFLVTFNDLFYENLKRCLPEMIKEIGNDEKFRWNKLIEQLARPMEGRRNSLIRVCINAIVKQYKETYGIRHIHWLNGDDISFCLNVIIKFLFELFLMHLITENMHCVLIKNIKNEEDSEIFYEKFKDRFKYILFYHCSHTRSGGRWWWGRSKDIINPFLFVKPHPLYTYLSISFGVHPDTAMSSNVTEMGRIETLVDKYFLDVINWLNENNKQDLKNKLLNAIIDDCKGNWKTDNTEEENLKNKFIDIVKSYIGV